MQDKQDTVQGEIHINWRIYKNEMELKAGCVDLPRISASFQSSMASKV